LRRGRRKGGGGILVSGFCVNTVLLVMNGFARIQGSVHRLCSGRSHRKPFAYFFSRSAMAEGILMVQRSQHGVTERHRKSTSKGLKVDISKLGGYCFCVQAFANHSISPSFQGFLRLLTTNTFGMDEYIEPLHHRRDRSGSFYDRTWD